MEPTVIQLPDTACVVLWDGRQRPYIVLDDFVREETFDMPPISRAVTIARLRALADVMENTNP